MKKRLVITLDEPATEKYLIAAGKLVEAEVNADCLPSGVTLTVHIAPAFGSTVSFGKEELGDVTVEFID